MGHRKESLTQQFVHEALRVYNPLKTVEILDPETHFERLRTLKYPIREKATAYICAGGKCALAENAAYLIKLIG